MPTSEINFKIQDEGRLAELGYTQELKREWGLWHNFGASFSIISVVTGIGTLFLYGIQTGGPGVMVVGWIIVSFFTLFVGTSMAEILSSIPTSGGPYFWAYMLAPQQHAPFFSWITGWCNLLGQIAVTTGIDFGLANFISTTAQVSNGYNPSPGKTLGILAVVLLSHVLINLFSIRTLRYMIYSSITFNCVGAIVLSIAVVAKAPHHQSVSFVFSQFYDGTGQGSGEGWSIRSSPAYVAVTGILMSQYTILGYDASAHLCEETRKAVRDAPVALVLSIVASAVTGFFLLVCLLFSIQDFEQIRKSETPVLDILIGAAGRPGGTALMVLVMLCVWHCGLFSLTSNSRMMFAFARDGGIPHRLHIIDRRFKSPVRTIIFGATCSFLLALPSLGSKTAFAGTTSIATIGLYVSYGIPIAMCLIWPRNWKKGPFNLRWASKPIMTVALLWICFITIVFCLPTVDPITASTLNYTPVALGIVITFALGSWFLWARKWFTGRCRNHCRICIRQLDFLGEEMMYRADGEISSNDDPRFKSEIDSASDGGTVGRRFRPPSVNFHQNPAGLGAKKAEIKISVGREFEVVSAPAREYEEV